MKAAYQAWGIETEVSYDKDGCEVSGEEYALITQVWVPEEQRGQGIGKKLVAEAIAEIKAAHPDMQIKLAALPFDSEMYVCDLVAWYEAQGFSVESTEGHAVVMTY